MQNRVGRKSQDSAGPSAARPATAALLGALLLLSVPLLRLPYGPPDWTARSQPYETPSSGAGTVTIGAVADATLDQAVPADNQGAGGTIWVGQAEAQQPAARRGLLLFDLYQVPADSVIESARLELYLGSTAGRAETEIGIFGVLDPWIEDEVTWDSAPALAPRLTSAVVGEENRYYAWDVTPLAQGWHAGTFANHGLLLRGTDESTAVLRGFLSREAGANPPHLVVTYVAAPTPPVPPATATPPATLAPTVTLTPTSTSTPSPVPSPTATIEAGGCDPHDPTSACSATLTTQTFVDHRCDGFYVNGVDRSIGGATVTVTLSGGERRSAITNARGFATFVQLPVPAGHSITVTITYPPKGPGGTAVVACTGSPEAISLTAADFGFGQFKFIPFRAQPATFGIP